MCSKSTVSLGCTVRSSLGFFSLFLGSSPKVHLFLGVAGPGCQLSQAGLQKGVCLSDFAPHPTSYLSPPLLEAHPRGCLTPRLMGKTEPLRRDSDQAGGVCRGPELHGPAFPRWLCASEGMGLEEEQRFERLSLGVLGQCPHQSGSLRL